MTTMINRREFGMSASALALALGLTSEALGQDRKLVETILGQYEIPLLPKRVVAIDGRTDLEPALALGLPIIGANHNANRSWVPFPADATIIAAPASAEEILALNPDLIVCSGSDPDSEWWPARRLNEIAPVLTTDNFDSDWQRDIRALADWLDAKEAADKVIAEYDGLVADLKARHASYLASHKIAALHYAKDTPIYLNGKFKYETIKSRVLADIGAITVDPALLGEDGIISYENLGTILGDVDAILVNDIGWGGLALLGEQELWNRLPAVKNGKVLESMGNLNYGSFYTAKHVLGEFDKLLTAVSA